jgi:hypothetical protein
MKTYTEKEVYDILAQFSQDWELTGTEKFMMEYCNRCSDAPSDDYIQKKEEEMISSYIN